MKIELKSIPAQLVASLSQQVVIPEIGPFTRQAFRALEQAITDAGVKMRGAPMAIYYDRMTETERGLMEIAWPIEKSFDASNITFKELPAMKVVSVAVSRDQADAGEIPACYGKTFEWIAQQGYKVAGPNRECHLARRDSITSDQPYIEIQIPIE